MKINFHFPHIWNNLLLELLEEPEFTSSLAYLVDFRNHKKLKITAREHSIELSNKEITIVIVVYVGFELSEYDELKNRPNIHLVCFSAIIPEISVFKDMYIKYIDKLAWIFLIIQRSDDDFIKKINLIKKLNIY